MTLISRKVDYALLLLCELAHRSDGASARGLAERFSLSRAFIANILKELCQAGFVESQRGIHGGYRLARRPADVTVHDVIAALEGEFRLTACSADQEHEECGLAAMCPVRQPLKRLHARLLGVLEDVTLADLGPDPELVTLGTETTNVATADLS
jgi:FeS assembly SUF system regulator